MARRSNISAQTRLLIAAFMARPLEWRYGYDLSKEIGLKSGTLYPLLIRLSDQGFLESEWLPPQQLGRPPRNAYRLTANGIALARAQAIEDPAGCSALIGVPA